ncbi:MAG: UDP-N-acetylmuramate--L-alanine ligase [Candidatus Thioglobus sp.]|nr:UDP-N-acetylmuramate--L-alanine ligase [Candidatus Thioglobus sp.]
MSNLHAIANTKIRKLHFIGIGGSGMSGIAEVLHNLGYQISGSDIIDNKITQRLQKLGCKISHQHHQKNVKGAQAVVVSSAIDKNNPELIQARSSSIPVVPRAEMLAEIMRFRYGIAVAGTHGKTTTTSLISHILSVAKLDPTYIIGGILNASGINAKLGGSDYLIVEADESDASFLHLQPMLSVITNIDQDHMGTYDYDYQKLADAFVQFTSNLPFYGTCILCVDDPGASKIINNIHRPLITYGLKNQADFQAINITQTKRQMNFDVICNRQNKSFPIKLNLIGNHNISNTLAAIIVARELDIKVKTIQQALLSFSGVARRLDYHNLLNIKGKQALLFDDYGHHPNEIKAVFSSLKNTYPHKRLLVIFQPHRFSRTRDLFDDFSQALSKADALILLNIYPANERPIPRINSSALATSIRQRSELKPVVVKNTAEVIKVLPNVVQNDDIILTLGAGNVHILVGLLLTAYAQT